MAMQPGTSPGASDLYRLLAESMIGYVDPYGEHPSNYTVTLPSASSSSRASYFPMASVTTELPRIGGRDLAASRNQHKEAEKQRRKRINSHLDKLRSLLLPCNSKVGIYIRLEYYSFTLYSLRLILAIETIFLFDHLSSSFPGRLLQVKI